MMKRIGKIVAAGGLVLALGACTTLGQIGSVYTALTDASVPQSTIAVAVQGFDIAKAAAAKYIVYCSPSPSPAGCDDVLIQQKIDPAIQAGTQARDGLWGFTKAHPGTLGSKGLYDALVQATSTLTGLASITAIAK